MYPTLEMAWTNLPMDAGVESAKPAANGRMTDHICLLNKATYCGIFLQQSHYVFLARQAVLVICCIVHDIPRAI